MYSNQNQPTSETKLYDMEYDLDTGDFFYLGEVFPSYYVSRVNYLGNINWIKTFTNIPAIYSLMYSAINEQVYHTFYSNSFTLVRINSTDGTHIQAHQVTSSLSQNDFYYS